MEETAKFLSVSFSKASSSDKLGVIVGKDADGDLCIKSVKSKGLLASSCIRSGQKIFQYNGEICMNMEKDKLIEALRKAVGTINLVVVNPTGDPNQVEFVKLPEREGVQVGDESESERKATKECSELHKYVDKKADVSVQTEPTNDLSFSSGASDLESLGADAAGFAKSVVKSTTNFLNSLSLWKRGKNGPRAQTKSFTFTKRCNERVGLRLSQETDGQVYVTKIAKESVFAQSPLRQGDRISMINGISCHDMDKAAVRSLLKRLSGLCTIVAIDDAGTPDLIECTVEKPTSLTRCGIVMQKNVEGSLEVAAVTQSGLFANSLLSSGDQICRVNSKACGDVRQAETLLTASSRFVSVLARAHKQQILVSETDTESSDDDDVSSDEETVVPSNCRRRPVRKARRGTIKVRETHALVQLKLKEFDAAFVKKAKEIDWQFPWEISIDLKMMCLRYTGFDAKTAVELCMEEAAKLA